MVLRWLFNILAAISAILFVASVCLWFRSYRISDDLERVIYTVEPSKFEMASLDLYSSGGGIYISRVVIDSNGDPHIPPAVRPEIIKQNGWRHVYGPIQISAEDYFGRQHGNPQFHFGYRFSARKGAWTTDSVRQFLIPWALPTLLFLMPPGFWLISLVRRRRSHAAAIEP